MPRQFLSKAMLGAFLGAALAGVPAPASAAPPPGGNAGGAPGPAGKPVPLAMAATIAQAPCAPGGVSAADNTVADQLRSRMNGRRVGHALDGYQVSCARAITAAVAGRRLDRRAAVIALTTAITESSLRNYTEAVDHDSLGLFQQRPSQGWGSPGQLVDPAYATGAFLDAMLREYPGNSWMNGDIGAICQRVQVSAVPDAYRYEVADAQLLADALWTGGGDPGGPGLYWVDTMETAPVFGSPTGTIQTGTLNKGTNYVFCKAWGRRIERGSAFNHWWLRTDPDSGPAGQYVSAFYLTRWGNDEAKANDGTVIPDC
ncbi:hypothetical protein [Actinoplanes sp. NPDC049681]|uniref:hypothetical protein n=1 Tax=Actinoplanes sp. NPDC049681 TaxID=3363905 RepID=UPI0037A2228D